MSSTPVLLSFCLTFLCTHEGAAQNWLTDGNLEGATKSIGTKDAYDLPFITNNLQRMRLSSSGQLLIGSQSAPDASAWLDIIGTAGENKGLLIPRLANPSVISSPATGLLVFNTTSNTFDFYNGTAWIKLATANAPVSNMIINETTLANSGALAGSALVINQTWGTTGIPSASKVNITNNGASTSSNLLHLLVGNQNVLRVLPGAFIGLGSGSNNVGIGTTVAGSSVGGVTGTALRYLSQVAATVGYSNWFSAVSVRTPVSGNSGFMNLTETFAPTVTGALSYNMLGLFPTINHVAGSPVITRGILISPTLTSAGNWRSIEFNNNSGWGLYGSGTAMNYLAGSLLIGSATDIPSAIINVSSTTKGALFPRMTTTERNAIASPAAGLEIYNTVTNTKDIYNGSAWVSLGSTATPTLQQVTSSGNTTTNMVSVGSIGVGVTNPVEKLEVDGNVKVSGALIMGSSAGTTGQILKSAGPGTAPVWSDVASSSWAISNNNRNILNTNPGYVYIGTAAPVSEALTDPDGNFKLYVADGIRTRKVKVDQAGWPDYVFDEGYTLPSLTEVAAYIKIHKHLEGIASAADVTKNGLDLGAGQAELLKKIEELTLYAINQDKSITLQQSIIELQKAKLAELTILLENFSSRLKKVENK